MTPRAPRTVEIDGFKYHLAALPPRSGLKLLVRVVRATGPGVITVMSAWTGGSKLLDMDMEALGSMARTMFAMLTPEEHDGIMAELLSMVQFEDESSTDGRVRLKPVMPAFNAHFIGRLPAVLKLEWEALAENYRDFGDALAGLVGKAGAAPSSEGSTPTPGPSTV